MTFKSALFGAVLACGLAASGIASAATIAIQTTPDGVAAATGLGGATLNFDGLTPGIHSSISGGGVTITSDLGSLIVDVEYPGNYNTFGRSLSNEGWAFQQLNFDFDGLVDGFGFFFGASDFDWILTSYDAAGNELESLTIAPLTASNAGDFFGIKADGIKRATLRSASTDWTDYVFVDNFTVGTQMPSSAVPEPATWAMMITGFGIAGAAVRRKRRQLAFS